MSEADWSTLNFKFAPFEALRAPLTSALEVLETVEAILEAVLDLVRIFLLDLTNPIQAIVALLLAAVRAIINQIKGTGFSVLLVHPDFSRQDIGAIFQSVSGSYAAFEGKVFNKFYDQSDIFRPMYPPGSSVAMLVLYIGQESPGDLLTQLFSLLNFIKHPSILTGLPAPVELKVRPVLKSDDPAAQFKFIANKFSDLWSDQGYEPAVVLEWRMPTNPSGANQPGFINSFTSLYNSFRFSNFVIERSVSPTGEAVPVNLDSTPLNGTAIQALMTKYNFPPPVGAVDLKEENNNVYRNFATKIPVSGNRLLEGFATGTYRYVDNDPHLVVGNTYYYRVRAYFGTPTDWLNTSVITSGADPAGDAQKAAAAVKNISNNTKLVKTSGSQKFIRYGDGVIMGQPSPVVKGFIPRSTGGSTGFNAYQSVFDAIQAAILLNFELPPAQPTDSAFEQDQKTGWGTLSSIGGQMGPLKAGFPNSQDLFKNVIFITISRRVANQVLGTLSTNTSLNSTLAQKWNNGVNQIVTKVLGAPGATGGIVLQKATAPIPFGSSNRPGPPINWKFPAIIGGINPANNARINAYLDKEATYTLPLTGPITGPLPITQYTTTDPNIDYSVSVTERSQLADFVRTCVSLTGNTSYLSWYSITLGDMFPAFIPFMNDFEQFMLALLKAVQSVIKEIEAIIETLIQKIQQFEQVLQTIISLIDLLDINISLSVLGVSSTNGSADSLAQSLVTSTNKPATTPFGLHSGMVMTFGGPGEGFIAAFNALGFILSAGQIPTAVST